MPVSCPYGGDRNNRKDKIRLADGGQSGTLSEMKITMIAALDRNRVIGTGHGGLPWRLPRDVAQFRAYTRGKFLLLGRKTYGEMTGWFTDQTPIVLSHRRDFSADGALVAHSIEEAVTEAFERGSPELVVCGGAAVYAAALPYADELRLTWVDTETTGQVTFPDFTVDHEWETLFEERHEKDAENAHAMTFTVLRRVKPSSLRPGRLHYL
jgi:dihydrofolate reductase